MHGYGISNINSQIVLIRDLKQKLPISEQFRVKKMMVLFLKKMKNDFTREENGNNFNVGT